MRPYGVEIVEDPDIDDILCMGARSSVGSITGRNGEHRGYRKRDKRVTRRRWKRAARRDSRREIRDQIDN